jgi:chromosome partitioning protein
MAVFVVANPKGGVGKSTISTNLAGYLAHQSAAVGGGPVLLGDVDRQESAHLWLSLRPPELPAIGLWETDVDDMTRLPRGTRHAVLDTPAGLCGKRLEAVMKHADQVLIPLQPSVFDIYATRDFITELHSRRKHAKVPIAVIGNRVREKSFAAEQLQIFLDSLGVPVLGHLRDTHNYVHLAAHGLTLWDVPTTKVARDLAQWKPVLAWLEGPRA